MIDSKHTQNSDLFSKLQTAFDELRNYKPQNVETKRKDNSFFVAKSAGAWINEASRVKEQAMLFDALWFENELCFLFSDTNVGKSILAVQIAQSIASSVPIPPFALTAPAQKVLYLDFELSKIQFRKRYSDAFSDFNFSENLIRAELNVDYVDTDSSVSFEKQLIIEIEKLVVREQAKVVIIDNITYLSNQLEKSNDALPLVKQLRLLKDKHDLSILVIAHTPKRDQSREISINDLAGSKALSNFCDSVFAIGTSKEVGIRYIKQLKARNSEIKYGTNNVPIFRLEKQGNFLGFTFSHFDFEKDILNPQNESTKHSKYDEIVELLKAGKSYTTIMEQLDINNKAIVARVAKQFQREQLALKDL